MITVKFFGFWSGKGRQRAWMAGLFALALFDFDGNEAGENLSGLLPRHIFAQHGKNGVGTRYCAKYLGRVAHVDVVGKSAGISVSRLDNGAVAREVERHKPY